MNRSAKGIENYNKRSKNLPLEEYVLLADKSKLLDNLIPEKAELSRTVEGLREERSESMEFIKVLQQSNYQLTSKALELEKQIESFKALPSTDDLNRTIQQLREEKANLEATIAEHIAEATTQFENLTAGKDKMERKIQKLRATQEQHVKQIAELKEQEKTLRRNCELAKQTEQELAELKEENEALIAQQTEQERRWTKLQEEKEELAARVAIYDANKHQPQVPVENSAHSSEIVSEEMMKQNQPVPLSRFKKPSHSHSSENLKGDALTEYLEKKIKTLEERQAQDAIYKHALKQENEKLKRVAKVKEILLLSRKLKYFPLKEFLIIDKLGSGANGIVFLVQATLPGYSHAHLFALKMILNFHQMNTLEVIGHYKNEYDVLLELTDFHPHIINILSEFTAQPTQQMIDHADASVRDLLTKVNTQTGQTVAITTQFFLTEYQPISLKQKFGSKLSVAEIYKYSRQLLDCSAFLFENHVVHRDVKMDNILVSHDDRLILSDFGESIRTDANHCCLKSNLRGGNMIYQAPEVLNAIRAQSASVNFTGQYSWEVGFLIYEMISGDIPFPGYPEVDRTRLRVEFGPIFEPFPEEFLALIDSMLEPEVGRRKGIVEALKEFDSLTTSI